MVDRAEDVFAQAQREFQTNYQHNNSGCWWGSSSSDIAPHNAMLEVYAQAGRADRAEAFLESMACDSLVQPPKQGRRKQQHQHEEEDDDEQETGRNEYSSEQQQQLSQTISSPTPNQVSFSLAALAWARSNDPEAPERAIYLMKRMMDPFDIFGQLGIQPSLSFCNNILSCWYHSGRKDAGEQAYQLLCEMKQFHEDHDEEEELVDVQMMMDEVDDDYLNDHDYDNHDPVQPDNVSYAIVVGAFLKSGYAHRAEQVIEELCDLFHKKNRDERYRPNLFMFTSTMDAWNKSNAPDKEKRVRAVFDRIQQLLHEGILVERPGVWTYNSLLKSIVSSLSSSSTSIPSSDADCCAKKGDEFLSWMKDQYESGISDVRPNIWTYTSVICAYLDTADGLDRAKELLEEAHDKLPDQHFSIKTYARVILAIAKSNDWECVGFWMNYVFDRTEEGVFGEESPSPSLLGGVVSRMVLAADENPEALTKADRLLERMFQLEEKCLVKEGPDMRAVQIVVTKWAHRRDKEGLQRAYNILQYLRQKATDALERKGGRDNGGKHSTRTKFVDLPLYAVLIRNFAKSNQAAESERVFRQFCDDHRRNPFNMEAPTKDLLNVVLSGWARHDELNEVAFDRAEKLLQEVRYLYQQQSSSKRQPQKAAAAGITNQTIAPDRTSYNTVLEIGSRFHVAASRMTNLFECMKEDYYYFGNPTVRPNLTSYKYMIRALSFAGLPDAAEHYLREAFQKDSFTKKTVTQSFKDNSTADLFRLVIQAWEKQRRLLDVNHQSDKRITNMQNWLSPSAASQETVMTDHNLTNNKKNNDNRLKQWEIEQRIQNLLALEDHMMGKRPPAKAFTKEQQQQSPATR